MSRFVTEAGVEVPSVFAARMRELDRIAVDPATPYDLVVVGAGAGGLAAGLGARVGFRWPRSPPRGDDASR